MKDKYIKYIEYIVNDIELPYLKYLEAYGLKKEDMESVLSKLFNQFVTIEYNRVYDTNGNETYYENSDGYWVKREYDNNNNEIYYENSNGYWIKIEYDSNGNVIYREDSDGIINDNR